MKADSRSGLVRHTGVVRSAAMLAVACLTCLVAACGNGGSDPLAGTPAKQVASKAIADLKAAPTFTMAGTVSESGSTYGVNLGYKKGTGCSGTVSQAGKGTIAVVVIGSAAWVKPDDAFWKATLGSSQGSQAITLLGGRYLKGKTSDKSVASLAKVCDVNQLVSSFTLPDSVGKGAVTTLNGQRAVPLTDKVKGGTMYVTDTSAPEIVEVVNTKAGSSGKVTFHVGAPVTLTAPPASQTIDGSQFGF